MKLTTRQGGGIAGPSLNQVLGPIDTGETGETGETGQRIETVLAEVEFFDLSEKLQSAHSRGSPCNPRRG